MVNVDITGTLGEKLKEVLLSEFGVTKAEFYIVPYAENDVEFSKAILNKEKFILFEHSASDGESGSKYVRFYVDKFECGINKSVSNTDISWYESVVGRLNEVLEAERC